MRGTSVCNMKHMKTSQAENNVADEQNEPVMSFTRVIEVAPSGMSFSGWGPKVLGISTSLTHWN